jgi:hypothetical protein
LSDPNTSFLARFGGVIVRGGISAIPSSLFHYQAELGLSAQHVWFISLILSYRWNASLPYPSISKLSEVTGVSRAQMHRYEREMVERGLLVIKNRFRPDGA